MTDTFTTRQSCLGPLKVRIGSTAPASVRGERWKLLLFDDEWQFQEDAPLSGEYARFHRSYEKGQILNVVLGPESIRAHSPGITGGLPTFQIVVNHRSSLRLPSCAWNWLEKTRWITVQGRLIRDTENSANAWNTEQWVECFRVDRWAWIYERTDTEIVWLRKILAQLLDHPARSSYFRGDPRRTLRETAWNPMEWLRMNVSQFRATLLAQRFQLEPFLGMTVPGAWYKLEKVSEVPLQRDGTFSIRTGWWCQAGKSPHLYFRVRSGKEERAGQGPRAAADFSFAPLIATGTWWNYQGEEVRLRPKSAYCG